MELVIGLLLLATLGLAALSGGADSRDGNDWR